MDKHNRNLIAEHNGLARSVIVQHLKTDGCKGEITRTRNEPDPKEETALFKLFLEKKQKNTLLALVGEGDFLVNDAHSDSVGEWYASAMIAGITANKAYHRQHGVHAITLMSINQSGLLVYFDLPVSHRVSAHIHQFQNLGFASGNKYDLVDDSAHTKN